MSFRTIALLFAAGVTLHNLEEAVFLVPWLKRERFGFRFQPNAAIYWVLTSFVSVVVWLLAIGSSAMPANRQMQYALAGFGLAMAFNAVFPHLATTCLKHSYMPGTATGVMFNLPFGAMLFSTQISFWLCPVLYALDLGTGSLAALYATHLWLARQQRR